MFAHCTEWLDLVGVAMVDGLGQLGILQVLVVLGWYDDQVFAQLPCFPINHPGFDTCLLGKIRLGKHDAMAIFRGTTHSNGLSLKGWIEHHLDRGIEGIQIAV